MPNMRSIITVSAPAIFCATAAIGCTTKQDTVFACDLVAMTQRVEMCQRTDATGVRIEMQYTFGNQSDTPELQFSTQNVWGNSSFEGYVDMDGLLGWKIGAVHPNGTVYAVYAYGRYDDNLIRRAVLQVYPSIDDFNNSSGAVFHAECKPSTIQSDDFGEYFRP